MSRVYPQVKPADNRPENNSVGGFSFMARASTGLGLRLIGKLVPERDFESSSQTPYLSGASGVNVYITPETR